MKEQGVFETMVREDSANMINAQVVKMILKIDDVITAEAAY